MSRTGVLVLVLGMLGLVFSNVWAQREEPAVPAPPPKAADAANGEQRPSLFEALRQALLGVPEEAKEEIKNLEQDLDKAEGVWNAAQADMRRGIKEMNRQLRANRHECPNIVLIVADDLGYGDLGCYGQERIKTPNLDRMAAEGLRFTDYYAGSPLDIPSHCSLMTGKHTGRGALRVNTPTPLPSHEVTVAEVLWKAGYTTGMFGRWVLGDIGTSGAPYPQGFEHNLGSLNFKQGANHFPEFLWRNGPTNLRVDLPGNQKGQKNQYVNDLITSESLQFLSAARRRPFFLFVSYNVPSANVEVPGDEPYSGETWTQAQKDYAAGITRMDGDVGRILARLDKLSLTGKTVVFFTSDNGPDQNAVTEFFNSNGPLRGGKGDLFEGGIRAPMIVRGPGRLTQGRVSPRPWAHWDFLPTAADIATAWRRPRNIDGISLLPYFRGRPASDATYWYWETNEGGALVQAVRQGKWKGIRPNPKAPLELYDLQSDAGEQNNVAAQNTAVVSELDKLMSAARPGI